VMPDGQNAQFRDHWASKSLACVSAPLGLPPHDGRTGLTRRTLDTAGLAGAAAWMTT